MPDGGVKALIACGKTDHQSVRCGPQRERQFQSQVD